jgi:hypothetical protein
MLNQATLDKLHALRLTGMAEAYCQGRSKTRPSGRSKSRPVIARSGCWICGVEGPLERSERGPSTPSRVLRGIVQRSEDEVRLRRLCLRR